MNEIMIGIKNLHQARRKAGKVKRFHTEFLIQPPQTLSDHIFNILRIWTSIWGVPPSEVLMEIMYHDFEELFIGDLPHWAHCQPEIKLLCEHLDRSIRGELRVPQETGNKKIRLVDQLEAMEFMVDEVNLGNETLREKLYRLAEKIAWEIANLPGEDARPINNYLENMGIADWFSKEDYS